MGRGSESIVWLAKDLKTDYVFNLQGDEPETDYRDIDKTIEFGIDNDCDVVQPSRPLTDDDLQDEDTVQMILNNGKVLHMERNVPTVTDNVISQVGMFLYKREVIEDFPNLDMTWVKYWGGLDIIAFCGKYDVIPFDIHTRTQAIDRPHHIHIVEQNLAA